jgi:hypothetical protein
MDVLSIVSLEGNWNAAINGRRLELASTAFRRSNADFIISSGTYKPGSSASECRRLKKLGERNTDTLRSLHDIDSALIIPVHAFPFEFTYTTIEAFGNACVIGWLTTRFERQSHPIQVDFAPISSGAHCRRVHVLNTRAFRALSQFNVETTVKPQQPLEMEEADMIESEERKLRELMRPSGVIATGRWIHGDTAEWSFDDPQLMRITMARLIKAVLPGSGEEQVDEIIRIAPLAQRYGIMQMLCEVSANRELSSSALERIFSRTARRFAGAFDEGSATRMAEQLARAALSER